MRRTSVIVMVSGAALAWAGTVAASEPAGRSGSDAGRAYGAELTADSAARTSRLDGGGLRIGDGDSSIKIGGFAQFRYITNLRENPTSPTTGSFHDSGFTNGFEATRTRLDATGNIGSRDLTFKVEGEFGRGDGSLGLLDAYGRYAMDNRTSVTWGQFKLPIVREWYISPTKQLAVNYSIAAEVFMPGYTQGVAVDWKGDRLRGFVSLNDGLNSSNTAYTSPGEADLAATGRLEYMWGKDWKRFDDFTSWRGESNTWMIGASAHWQTDGNTGSSAQVAQQQFEMASLDATFEGNGWNLYAAAIYLHTDPYQSPDATDWGFVLQGGVFVTDNVEVFGRWDGVFVDSDRGRGLSDDLSTITVGGNWYLLPHSHAAKFTADAQWNVNSTNKNALVAGILGNNTVGLQGSSEDNQVALRVQFQLVF